MSELLASCLSKKYRGRHAVRNVSLTVGSGEIVGLLGPNGAGKTTVFYMILGLVEPDSGRVFLDSEEIGHLPMSTRARRGIGYLPQESSVFRRLSVEDNLLVALEARKGLDGRTRRLELEKLLDEFRLQHVRSSRGMALSGGERRKVEIARAVATEPVFVLFDEPFAGIDPVSVGEIQKLIRHLSGRGIGVLITDHNVRAVLSICSRACIVDEGEVIVSGSAREVAADERVRQSYLGDDFHI